MASVKTPSSHFLWPEKKKDGRAPANDCTQTVRQGCAHATISLACVSSFKLCVRRQSTTVVRMWASAQTAYLFTRCICALQAARSFAKRRTFTQSGVLGVQEVAKHWLKVIRCWQHSNISLPIFTRFLCFRDGDQFRGSCSTHVWVQVHNFLIATRQKDSTASQKLV